MERNDPCVVPLRGKDTTYRERGFIPPHQSLTRQLPPKGKPSLHCANTANVAYTTDMSNISLSCGLPLRFALVALSCSAKGILQKGFPLGGRWRRRRRMRAESSFHYPPNKREAALFQRFAPPDTPKTSLCGNRRPKNAENPHNPKRRLPCREVRGGSGRFGG